MVGVATEIEPDQRHVEVLLTELGLAEDNVKGAATSWEKRSEGPSHRGSTRSVAEA